MNRKELTTKLQELGYTVYDNGAARIVDYSSNPVSYKISKISGKIKPETIALEIEVYKDNTAGVTAPGDIDLEGVSIESAMAYVIEKHQETVANANEFIKNQFALYVEKAQINNYKEGWVFYKMKDNFGYEIALQYCA